MKFSFDFEYLLECIHFYAQVFNYNPIISESYPTDGIFHPNFNTAYINPVLNHFSSLCIPTNIPVNRYKSVIKKSTEDFMKVHNFFYSPNPDTVSAKIEKMHQLGDILIDLNEDIKDATKIDLSSTEFDGEIIGNIIYEINHINTFKDICDPAFDSLSSSLKELSTALRDRGFVPTNPYEDLIDANPVLTLNTISSCLPSIEDYLSYKNPSASLFENATEKLRLRNLAKTNVSTVALALKYRELI